MGDSIATEYKPIRYTLTCDECGEEFWDINIKELLTGLPNYVQIQILLHHRTHSIPEPTCVCGRTLWWHDTNNLKRCDSK